jgi:CheY-like chemotaxis protein
METDVLLLVEDESADVLLFERAFKRSGLPFRLEVLRDGGEAVKYLAGEPPFTNAEKFKMPKILVMDLFMSKVDGFELLRWIRKQPRFASLPVMVLTGTVNSDDVIRAYANGASLCLEKSSNFGAFERELKRALEFLICSKLHIAQPVSTEQARQAPQ